MKKKLFTLLFALVAIATTAQAQVVLNETNFPDANFRAALASKLRISEGDEITEAKIAATTSLNVQSKSLSDLTGIEHFTALTELNCCFNQLTELNVSSCTALTLLYCYDNQLTALDVSKNTALTELRCFENRLTSLDVSQNTALTGLNCNDNQLTSLDVSSKNTALERLNCRANKIKSKEMDALVESLPMVESGKFYVINTKYKNEGNVCTKSQVGIAKGKGWTVYDYNGGNSQEYEGSEDAAESLLLNAENFPDANFRAALASILGISEGDEIALEKIMKTTYLDVSSKSIADLTGIEHFTALTYLYCFLNQLTSLDVSKNTKLKNLVCHRNQLTALDVSKNVALTQLICWQNQLTSLDVSKNTALTALYCDDTQLSSLDVSKNTALIDLRCSNTLLTSLDVSQNILLQTLYCYQNKITSLDVSKNTALTELYCHENQLTSLDVSGCTALTKMTCFSNKLTSLNVSGCTALTNLYCYENQLTSLDVSKNTALVQFRCDKNQLTSLDVSKNTALEQFRCDRNQLTSLDVSQNILLQVLYCYNNKITSLDVSKNTALTNFVCYENELTSLNVLKNTRLNQLVCFSNKIKNAEMDALVASLPTVENGKFYVINTKDTNEGNVCTKAQVVVAKGKGWTVYDFNGHSNDSQEYEGSDPVEEDINPVDEDDNIDFGSDMDENSDLDGNVIGNIYYNVGNGNGEYDAENGCVVITKPTDDGTMNDLEGKDIFGEDFKGQFTGIAFKVPTGKGTVKVTAETTGNMLLKVKIGNNDPVDMELKGKLKISFPYNVTEETFVYIYAGVSNEAKDFGKASSTDAALKIYGIEFLRDDTTPIDNLQLTNDNLNNDWYSIDGVKLQGEPMKKGIYIYKGKKVKR